MNSKSEEELIIEIGEILNQQESEYKKVNGNNNNNSNYLKLIFSKFLKYKDLMVDPNNNNQKFIINQDNVQKIVEMINLLNLTIPTIKIPFQKKGTMSFESLSLRVPPILIQKPEVLRNLGIGRFELDNFISINNVEEIGLVVAVSTGGTIYSILEIQQWLPEFLIDCLILQVRIGYLLSDVKNPTKSLYLIV